jgi:hypothetical protein
LKEVPTIRKNYLKMKEEIKFPGTKGLMHPEESLFKSKKCKNEGFFLFEHGEESVLEDRKCDCIEIINV